MTPPPAPPPHAGYYQLGNSVTFTWTPNFAPQDGIAYYMISVGTTPGGTNVANQVEIPYGTNSYTFAGTPGLTYYATMVAVSNAGVTSTTAAGSDAGPPNPSSPTTPVKLLDPAADDDGDGQSNAAEDAAGTNPLSNTSTLKVTSIGLSGGDVVVTAATVAGKTYQLETSICLQPPWVAVGSTVTASGSSTVFTHQGGAASTTRYYRVRVVP